MNIDFFSRPRAAVARELQAVGAVMREPGTPEHRACLELVAFGRAFQVPGDNNVFCLERRVGPRTSR
jgi:hypothetical protein